MKMPTAAIREEIHKSGVISFARFMALALYCPETGYYESQKDNVGRRGDFITSVSTGSLFGELLAFQFAEWLEGLRISDRGWGIIEAGAHDGKLAADILSWLQIHRPKLFTEIEYVILEPSARRQTWQRAALKIFAPRVRWLSQFNDSTIQQFNGIIFSNELLDAFPVHRHGWDAEKKEWFEWGVTVAGDGFGWAKIANPPFAIRNWKPCCRMATSSKPVLPPKLGGAPPPEFWRAANCWRLTTASLVTKCFRRPAFAARFARIIATMSPTICWPIRANRI